MYIFITKGQRLRRKLCALGFPVHQWICSYKSYCFLLHFGWFPFYVIPEHLCVQWSYCSVTGSHIFPPAIACLSCGTCSPSHVHEISSYSYGIICVGWDPCHSSAPNRAVFKIIPCWSGACPDEFNHLRALVLEKQKWDFFPRHSFRIHSVYSRQLIHYTITSA